jgi:hypothetical protein
MRNFITGCALLLGGAGVALAAGTVSGGGSGMMSGASTTVANPTVNNRAMVAPPGNGIPNLPPPPPADVTTPAAIQGVPPTPSPSLTIPGLPVPPTSGTTPGTTGLPSQVANDLRQTQAVTGPVDIAQVQNALASAGFYKGPIDGTLAAPTRAAVRSFQAAMRLPTTGLLDAATVAALGVAAIPANTTTVGGTTMTTPTATPTTSNSSTFPGPTGVSINSAGGVTTNPGTPTVPAPGVTGGGSTTQRTTEPFPLSTPAQQSYSPPIFVQP